MKKYLIAVLLFLPATLFSQSTLYARLESTINIEATNEAECESMMTEVFKDIYGLVVKERLSYGAEEMPGCEYFITNEFYCSTVDEAESIYEQFEEIFEVNHCLSKMKLSIYLNGPWEKVLMQENIYYHGYEE